MYDYGYTDYEATSGLMEGSIGIVGIMLLISAIAGILMLISQWKVYKKAGKGGWECLIPIYNIIVLLQIAELPIWYIVLYMIPIANIYAIFKTYIELAHKFGKSTGFGVGLTLVGVVFFPLLAFDKKSIYNGQNNQNPVTNLENNVYNPMNTVSNEAQEQTEINSMNNNNNTNFTTESTPIMFNQNINTEINSVEPAQNTENTNLNFQVETPVVPTLNQEVPVTEPVAVNPQPELNFSNPVNTEPQVLNTELNPAVEMSSQEPAQFTYNPSLPETPVVDNVQASVNPVEQSVIPEQQPLNVIPGMNQAPVVNPQVPENNQNNATM